MWTLGDMSWRNSSSGSEVVFVMWHMYVFVNPSHQRRHHKIKTILYIYHLKERSLKVMVIESKNPCYFVCFYVCLRVCEHEGIDQQSPTILIKSHGT